MHMDSTTNTNSNSIIGDVCRLVVCDGECGDIHPDYSVPEREVHWSWLPATPKARYMGEWWVRGGVRTMVDPDDMSNEC